MALALHALALALALESVALLSSLLWPEQTSASTIDSSAQVQYSVQSVSYSDDIKSSQICECQSRTNKYLVNK